MIRIHIVKLIKLVKQEEYSQLFKELPTGLVEILNLLKKSFRWLIKGNYIIEEARKALLPYFYNFFKINLEIKSKFLY